MTVRPFRICIQSDWSAKISMSNPDSSKTIALGMLGAVLGGCLGYVIFHWMARQGMYALVIPPALVGLGAGFFAQRRSQVLALTCAIAGLALGLFIEWRFRPFKADASLQYFLTHVHLLKPLTTVMLLLGAIFSYRFALGRSSGRSA
jgi:hypothetical protein